jgi:hypothetical protein
MKYALKNDRILCSLHVKMIAGLEEGFILASDMQQKRIMQPGKPEW